MASAAPTGRLAGKNAIITGAAGYDYLPLPPTTKLTNNPVKQWHRSRNRHPLRQRRRQRSLIRHLRPRPRKGPCQSEAARPQRCSRRSSRTSPLLSFINRPPAYPHASYFSNVTCPRKTRSKPWSSPSTHGAAWTSCSTTQASCTPATTTPSTPPRRSGT